jgi:hypothetical protein
LVAHVVSSQDERGHGATDMGLYVAGIGGPVAALLSFPLTNLVTRRGAKELETRSRREEVLRNLRWASELAVDTDERKAKLGWRN